MLNKTLTIQLTELTVTSIPKGRFLQNVVRTIVCEAIQNTQESGIIHNVAVTYNYDRSTHRDSIYYEQDWLSNNVSTEIFTVKHTLQKFVMDVMDRFNISDVKENHVLNFNTALITNNLIVISYNLVGEF